MAEPIPPGRAPGGIVFHIWVDGRLRERRIPGIGYLDEAAIGRSAIALGEEDADAAFRDMQHSLRIEVFDGDTGAWVMTRIFLPMARLRG
jgi:hypothetical protein